MRIFNLPAGRQMECIMSAQRRANVEWTRMKEKFCVALLTEKMYLWSECVRRVESTFIGFSQRAFFRTANHEKCFIRWFSLDSPDVSLKLINFFTRGFFHADSEANVNDSTDDRVWTFSIQFWDAAAMYQFHLVNVYELRSWPGKLHFNL